MRWRASRPLIVPPEGAWSVKDPSVIRFAGDWHVFATVRAERPSHRIVHFLLEDPAVMTPVSIGYAAAAPQVFLHRRDGRFFLVYQAAGLTEGWCPAYSANETLDPKGWSPARPLYAARPSDVPEWLDFWVIGDGERTFLFFTSLDGRMWRAETATDRFPEGFGAPVVCLQADLFEAAHVYRFEGRFFCIVEAKRLGRRYQRLFVAERLDGEWTSKGLFAAGNQLEIEGERWTDSVSHGELIREGMSERMEVKRIDRYLFQGARDVQIVGRPYARIPWRIGLLEAVLVDQVVEVLRQDLDA